jgi:hypothetical protein
MRGDARWWAEPDIGDLTIYLPVSVLPSTELFACGVKRSLAILLYLIRARIPPNCAVTNAVPSPQSRRIGFRRSSNRVCCEYNDCPSLLRSQRPVRMARSDGSAYFGHFRTRHSAVFILGLTGWRVTFRRRER